MSTLFEFDFYIFNSMKKVNDMIITSINQTAKMDHNQSCSILSILSVQFLQIARYRLVATSCCWNQSINHRGDQRIVILTLPISFSVNPFSINGFHPKLIYQLSNNCHVNLKLVSSDVKCQWARQYSPLLGNQCGGICGQLPESYLDPNQCTITFKPTRYGTYQFAIIIQPTSTKQYFNQTHSNHSSTILNNGLINFPLQATIIVSNRHCLGERKRCYDCRIN